MKFGQARELITPSIRTTMSGYASRTEYFSGIHDDLYVKSAYMENKGAKLLIITYDLCHYTYDLNESVMSYALEKYHIPYNNIIINYSHTHAGPKITSMTENEELSPLHQYFIERTKTCIDRCFVNIFEGTLQIARTTGSWNINRRLKTETGFKLKPNYTAPTDDEMVIMLVRDTFNTVRTIFVNYSCHPVTLSGTLFLSSEYPGRMCALLEAEYYGSMAFFLQGSAGNMRPLVTADKGSFKACSFIELNQLATTLANHVMLTIQSTEFETLNPHFLCTKFVINLPINPVSKTIFEEKIKNVSGYLKLKLDKVAENFDSIEDSVAIHCGIVKLTENLYIPYMGGEIVYEIKLLIENIFKPANILFLGYHEAATYIPDDKIILEGGYEGYDAPIYTGFRGPFKSGIDEIISTAFKEAMITLNED